jgi:hypothetical protein
MLFATAFTLAAPTRYMYCLDGQVCIRFSVVDHFIGKKRVEITKFDTDLTVQTVCTLWIDNGVTGTDTKDLLWEHFTWKDPSKAVN